MVRTMALAAALAFTFFGAAKAQAPRPPREELSERALEHMGRAPARAPESLKPPAPGAATRFGGKLYVVMLDDKTHPSLRDGRTLWALTEELVYWPSNDDKPIVVPRGFVTDLASIPRPLWWWLPPDGPWAKAAVIHDYLYYTQGTGVWKCRPTTLQRTYTKDDADWILRDAQKDRNVGPLSRNLIWFGVHLGGQGGWDNSPGANEAWCRDHPPKPAEASPGTP